MPPKFRRSMSRDDLRNAEDVEKESLLDHDSEPDEDMLFNRPSTSIAEVHTNSRIHSVKIQIQEVTDAMRENVKKVMERGEKIEDLQEASDRLSLAGNEFREAARRAHRKAWMQNVKSRIIVIGITVTVVLCIVVSIVVKYS
ncbi:vesicle-associated membrane protein 4 isoform X2 [Orussus abietinus]|uniref:vesicle-associated membrane protein 4 isoform X2 n=1 Tax=Orussus abietinus TaxID=222816 RepID=UPI000625631A|nr:vesicle-associated membrane protein 4 isoform X2 [Orussus abietinus]